MHWSVKVRDDMWVEAELASPAVWPCVGYSRPYVVLSASTKLSLRAYFDNTLYECLIPWVFILVCIEHGEWWLLFTCKLPVQENMLVLMRLTLTREHDVVGTSLQLKQVHACVTPVATCTPKHLSSSSLGKNLEALNATTVEIFPYMFIRGDTLVENGAIGPSSFGPSVPVSKSGPTRRD
jgi:hypothetical protein